MIRYRPSITSPIGSISSVPSSGQTAHSAQNASPHVGQYSSENGLNGAVSMSKLEGCIYLLVETPRPMSHH